MTISNDFAARIRDLERERDEAREIVAQVNNSVIGSYGWFTKPSCVDAVEQVKWQARTEWLRAEEATKLLREAQERGLIYWAPATDRGARKKADMVSRIEQFLSPDSEAPLLAENPSDGACITQLEFALAESRAEAANHWARICSLVQEKEGLHKTVDQQGERIRELEAEVHGLQTLLRGRRPAILTELAGRCEPIIGQHDLPPTRAEEQARDLDWMSGHVERASADVAAWPDWKRKASTLEDSHTSAELANRIANEANEEREG